MNAEVRQIKTAAELALAESYATAKARLPGRGSVAAAREAAFRRFETQGLPHRRVEEWKYTDLRALMRDAKPLAGVPDAAARQRGERAGRLFDRIDTKRLVLVNGVFVPALSDLDEEEPGLTIRSMAEALAAGDPLVTAHLGQVVSPNGDVAVALNTAFMGDGAVIRVAKGATVGQPIHLVYAFTDSQPAAVFTRSLVVVEEGARLTLVESHEGPDDIEYQVNTALELVVGDGADVDHVKIGIEGINALHVATFMAAISGHARFSDFIFTTGSAVTRNQLFVRINGEHTTVALRGTNLLNGRQHIDTTLVVDHAVGHGVSRELYKSVLDDDSRAVFQGKIIVQPDARKTDGKMMTRALLLSESAEADAKPELEIFADDVVCGHGATVGALDEDLLFYLEARGIPQKEAEALLVQAFIGEAVEGIEHAGLREVLMEAAIAWLAARGRRCTRR